MESESVVTIQHLVKKYARFVAVNDISFPIKEGEIFGIIGPNGAGKTTMVECISGLRVPDSGSIAVHGFSRRRIEIGYESLLEYNCRKTSSHHGSGWEKP